MLGSEGAEAHVFKVLREAQRAQEQRDGRGGKNVCCERESAYEDIDLASVGALVKFWETVVVGKKHTLIGDCLLCGVGVFCTCEGSAKDVCRKR